MKFSKLIKNSNKRQEMKLKRNAVLLSGIYSTQSPTVVNNYFTPSKPTTTTSTFLADIEKTIVPQTPQTYEQRYNINTIASTTKKTPTFKISPLAKLFEFKSSSKDAVESALAKQRLIQCLLETPGGCKVGTITPRFAKSEKSKAKRLQRRGDLGVGSARKYELRSSASTGFDQVDNHQQTPKTSLFSATKKQSTKCLLDFNSITPNTTKSPATTTTNSSGNNKSESMVTRIKKFVSKSALKVSSQRKSFGSQCSTSSLSSCNDSSLLSSDDSFCNRSMEQKRINLNLEKLIDEDHRRNQTAKVTAWSYQKPSVATVAPKVPERPSMGLTSVMLKNQRRVNPKASVSSCMPSVGLLTEPHVFEKPKILVAEESNYDRLNYNQVKQQQQQQGRKVTGGNVQRMVNKFQKNKSVTAIGQQASPKITRISVYAKKTLSAVNLNESQQYDSIIF